jgi:glutaconate CoA-transferase subunit B
MAVMGFDGGEMVVESLHPGIGRETVQEATGWDLRFADDLTTTEIPTDDTLHLIREELDPDGVYLS